MPSGEGTPKRDTALACECCGHTTLQGDHAGEICVVCGWDVAPEGGGHAVGAGDDCSTPFGDPLAEAQQTYVRIGACHPSWVGLVRNPTVDEKRSESWTSIGDARHLVQDSLMVKLEQAFGEVKRDGGVSLHQLELLDSLIGAHRDDLAGAEKLDPEYDWQQIADEDLCSLLPFPFGLFFLDARGFRFYIPAYIRLIVRSWARDSSLFLPLDLGPWPMFEGTPYHQAKYYALLSKAQREAIAEFLTVARYCGFPEERRLATKYLRSYWNQFVVSPDNA